MFYGKKLYEIREMFSYTRKDLAEALNLNEQVIWQFETNQITPNFQVINNLKNIFHVQASFFFQDSYLGKVSETSRIAYRKKSENLRSGVQAEKRYLDFFFTHVHELEQVVYPSGAKIYSVVKEIENKYNLTQLSIKDVQSIAESTRSAFGLSDNERLMFYLELSGIYIVERSLEETVDAYSSWVLNDAYPVIVLNKGKNPAVRRNFDMAHELGHLLMHRYINFDQLDADELTKVEKEANLFASYFTLAQKELEADLNKLSDLTNPKSYILLKKKYRMSIQSIAYRAYQEGWLSKEENHIFWRNLIYAGYKAVEPLDAELTIHIPGKIRALFIKALEVNNGLITEWLDKYSVDVEYFEKIFGIKDDLLKNHVGKQGIRYPWEEHMR